MMWPLRFPLNVANQSMTTENHGTWHTKGVTGPNPQVPRPGRQRSLPAWARCPMQRRPRIFQDSFAASVRFLASLALGVDDLGVDYFPVLLPSLAPCGTACGKERQKGIHSAGISLCPCPRTVPGGGGGGGSTTG